MSSHNFWQRRIRTSTKHRFRVLDRIEITTSSTKQLQYIPTTQSILLDRHLYSVNVSLQVQHHELDDSPAKSCTLATSKESQTCEVCHVVACRWQESAEAIMFSKLEDFMQSRSLCWKRQTCRGSEVKSTLLDDMNIF